MGVIVLIIILVLIFRQALSPTIGNEERGCVSYMRDRGQMSPQRPWLLRKLLGAR